MIRYYIFLFFSNAFLFAQNNFEQVEIKVLTTMDIAYAGKILLNSTQHVSDGVYLEEVASKYEKFYVRMFAGGNRAVGKILNRKNQTLTMYDRSKKKYSEEYFENIRKNMGIPSLKDITKFEPGGNNNQRDSTKTSTPSDLQERKREIVQTVSSGYEKINNFNCKKIITIISDSNGSVRLEEWVTTDTSIFSFAENELKLSISSYNGEYKKPRRSSDWIKSIDSKKKIKSSPGEVVKSSILWKNNKGEASFSMMREVLSARIVENDPSSFVLPGKFKKVTNLE